MPDFKKMLNKQYIKLLSSLVQHTNDRDKTLRLIIFHQKSKALCLILELTDCFIRPFIHLQ